MTKGNLEYQCPWWEKFEALKLNFLKQNWTAIALKCPKLSEIPVSISILGLPNIVRSLKLSLCEIKF